MIIKKYNRKKVVEYAHKWAYDRNPSYYDYHNIGGDCTNFVSQAIYAGAGVMNYTPTFGWFYNDADDHSPSWTGVEYLHKFLVNNKESGPFGKEVTIGEIEPGDIIQLSADGSSFYHSVIVIDTGSITTIDNVMVAAHSFNTDNRPLGTYDCKDIRYIHILGVYK